MKCPNDNEEMDYVDSWETEYSDVTLFQCPKCKIVKVTHEPRVNDD